MNPRIFLVFALLFFGGCAEKGQPPFALKGRVDLSGWHFSQNGPVPLNGEWEFYWKKLLTPLDFQKGNPEKTGYLKLPGSWKGYSNKGRTLSGEGYATFRQTINITPGYPLKVLRIKDIGSVCQIWVNGVLTASSGKVGTSPETEIPRRHELISASLPDNVTTLDIIMQVSNYHWQKVALRSAIVLGEESQIRLHVKRDLSLAVFFSGMLLMIGLYHLVLYLLLPKEPANLYCCFTCMSWSVFILFSINTGCPATALFPTLPWHVFIDVEVIAMIMGAMTMAVFYHAVFRDRRFRLIVRGFLMLGGILIICTMALPPRNYFPITILFYLVVIIMCLYVMVLVILDFLRREPDICFLIPGYLAIAVAGANDSLRELGVAQTPFLTHYGLFVFILSLSFLVSFRSARTQKAVETLSRELEQKNIALVKADRLKDEFLANTSHELRTPLSGIIGLADSLLNGVAGKVTKTMAVNLTMISSSGKRLANLINDILDFSKLKNHEISLHLRPVDIKALSDIVIAFSGQIARGKSILIENRMPDNLPMVRADEDRLQQVLFNLVGNAVKFTQAGTIVLRARGEEDRVTVSISDTGAGIPPDRQESIFRPFEQADASISRPFQGAGLGLGISRTLIQLHQGDLWLESSSDKGSTFCFTLPKSDEQHAVNNQQRSDINRMFPVPVAHNVETPCVQPASRPSGLPADAPHVLVVDDDPVNLQVAVNSLSMAAFQISTATGGQEVFELVAAGSGFDLVLLDIMMPEISGLDVCRWLRNRYSSADLPILMVTAKNRLSDLVEGLACGANDYIAKPFAAEELLARVRTHLTVRDAHRALKENRALKHEIRQRKLTELSLRLTQRRLAGMLDIIEDAVAAVNGSGEICFANKIFETRFGYQAERILGMPLQQYLDEDGARFLDKWIRLMAQKEQGRGDPGKTKEMGFQNTKGHVIKQAVMKAVLKLEDENILVMIIRENVLTAAGNRAPFHNSRYIIQALNRNRERLHALEDSLNGLTPLVRERDADFIHNLHTIDSALGRIGKDLLEAKPSPDRRTLCVDLMVFAVDAWCSETGKEKSQLAIESGLWSVYTSRDGNPRTQTLDRYLNIHTLPKRPRWQQIIKTAEFVLESCDLKPLINEQLETMLFQFRSF